MFSVQAEIWSEITFKFMPASDGDFQGNLDFQSNFQGNFNFKVIFKAIFGGNLVDFATIIKAILVFKVFFRQF